MKIKDSRDSAVLRVLASHQCGLGSIPAQCHMFFNFVVGCRLASAFLRVLQFSSLHKHQPLWKSCGFLSKYFIYFIKYVHSINICKGETENKIRKLQLKENLDLSIKQELWHVNELLKIIAHKLFHFHIFIMISFWSLYVVKQRSSRAENMTINRIML